MNVYGQVIVIEQNCFMFQIEKLSLLIQTELLLRWKESKIKMVVNQAADNLTWHLFFGPIVVFRQLLYILLDYFEFNDVYNLEMNITHILQTRHRFQTKTKNRRIWT